MSSKKQKKEHVNETQKSFLPNHLRPLTYKKGNEITLFFYSDYKIVKNTDNIDFNLGQITYYGWSTARRIIRVPLTIRLQKTDTPELRQFTITQEDLNSKSTDWFFRNNKRRVLTFVIEYLFLDENENIIRVDDKGTKTGKAMTTNEDDEDDKELFLQRFHTL